MGGFWKFASLLLIVLLSASAQAELLEFSFTDKAGSQKVLKSEARFANPESDITFALSAGIDRRIRVGLFQENGLLHDQATSRLLGALDRISVDGKSYYGARLSLTPPDDGSYTIKAEILTSEGDPVQTDSYPIVFDTTAPSYGDFSVNGLRYGMTDGDAWKLGRGSGRGPYFLLSDIADNQDIADVQLVVRRASGDIHREKSVDYDETTESTRVYFDHGIFPSSNLDEEFKVSFVIKDISGNVTKTPVQKAFFDNYVGAPSRPFGVFDPDSSNNLGPGLTGFVPYQDGMIVKTNPIRVAWKIPKSNWHEYNSGGLSIANSLGENVKSGEDASNVYIINSAPHGNTNSNYWRFRNFGQWGGGGVRYSLALSDSAPESPSLKGLDYKYGDIGWSNFRRYWVDNSLLPLDITGIRVNVEPRSYPQTAKHRGSCVVPPGSDSCYINTSMGDSSGVVYSCEDGWSLNGENCEKETAKPSEISCPSGYSYSSSSGQCRKYTQRTAYQQEVGLSCRYGWSLSSYNGDSGYREGRCVQSEPAPTVCPTGYQPNPTHGPYSAKCVKVLKTWNIGWPESKRSECSNTYVEHIQAVGYPAYCIDVGPSISCPEPGSQIGGNECRSYEYQDPILKNQCNGSLSLRGNYGGPYECAGYITRAAGEACPDGGVFQNGSCVVTESLPAEPSCKDGYNLDGNLCLAQGEEPPESLFATLSPGTTGYIHNNATVWNEDRSLRSNPLWAEVNWNDLHYPELDYSFDPQTNELSVFIVQKGRGAYFDRLRLKSSWLEDENGNKLSASGGKTADSNTNYTYQWNLTSLPEGTYKVFAVAEEMHGPVSKLETVSFDSDKTPPEIDINIADGSSIQSLDEIEILVSDNYDAMAGVSAINLKGGPASDNIELSWREIDSGKFNLEYPVMFPSMRAGDTYELSVTAADDQGNSAREVVSFLYEPPLVQLVGDSSREVLIPAVGHSFTRDSGHDVIQTEPLELSDGSVVQGSYDVYATLRSDSDIALKVNGVVIQPGATMSILPSHNFSSSGGRLSIPVSVVESGDEGTASLLVTTAAPNAPVLVADIKSWMPNVKLESSDWSIYPALQNVDIKASVPESAPCSLTADPTEAQSEHDPISSPVCLLKWTSMPDEGYPSALDSEGKGLSLKGHAAALGIQSIGYEVLLYDQDGSQIMIESGSKDLEVLVPDGVVGIEVDGLSNEVERLIQRLDIELKATSGLACDLTTSEVTAMDQTAMGRQTCLIEWDQVPSGLSMSQYDERPRLNGTVDEHENESDVLSWQLYAFTPSGKKVAMGQYEQPLTLVDPPAPVITMEDDYLLDGNLYASPYHGGYIGDYSVQGRPSNMEVESYLDESLVESELIDYYWGDRLEVRRRVITGEAQLWEEQVFAVSARYERLPRLEATKTLRLLTVPDENLRPTVTPDREVALNTKSLGVTVEIKNPYEDEAVYDPGVMGEWDVRLVNMQSLSDRVPLTEFKRLDGSGKSSFDLDLLAMDVSGFRLMAEARLISPVESYERTVYSPRPAYITVLRGGKINSSIDARRLVGEAPLMILASVDLKDRLDYGALGEIIWEERKLGSSDWKTLPDDSAFRGRLVRTYPAGQYELRARVTNANSQAEFITESVEVLSFNIPEVELSGPENIFIGDTANYSLDVRFGGKALGEEDVIVQWSEDDGESWADGSFDYSLTRNERTRATIDARVRMKNAPAGFEDSWFDVGERVSFREVEAPRIGIYGPRLVEVDREQEWRGVMRTPYRQMDVNLRGEFILPDGTTQEGEFLNYTPKEEDLGTGYIHLKYRAWIEGFEDQGAETVYERRIRIWEYEWPNWTFYIRQSAYQAPADVHLRIRNPSGSDRYIEGLEYEWMLPNGGTMLEDRYSDGRSLRFEEAGTYTVKAEITDDRGNASIISHDIVLDEQDPWLVNFSYRSSNEYQRAPLSLSFRPDVDGGHPRDRLREFRYFKNGKKMSEGERYGEVTLDEGTHIVALEIESEFGHRVMSEQTVQVNPNKRPSCDIRTRTSSTGWRFYANCEDPDGDIEAHQWTLDGEIVGISGSRISVTSRDGEVPSLTLTGIDDSGAKSEVIIW